MGGRSADRKAEREQVAKEWTKQRPITPSLRTVFDAIDLYLSEAESKKLRALKTIEYRARWVGLSWGDWLLADVTVPDICAWIHAIENSLPPNTLHGRVDTLRAVLETARKHGAILRNPAKQLPAGILPARKSLVEPETELLSSREILRLFENSKEYGSLWLFLALTGCRFGEAAEVRGKDVDLSAPNLARLTVSRSWSRQRKTVDVTKADSVRTIPIHPTLLKAIRPHVQRADALLFPKHPSPRHRDHQIKHEQLNDKTILVQFHRDLDRAGLSPRRVHSLRHTFVSLALSGGAREEVVESMTHPKRTTRRRLSVYAHYSWASKCEAIRNIELGGAVGAQLDLFGGVRDVPYVAATTSEDTGTTD